MSAYSKYTVSPAAAIAASAYSKTISYSSKPITGVRVTNRYREEHEHDRKKPEILHRRLQIRKHHRFRWVSSAT